MKWTTAKGNDIEIKDLADSHLTNILRMLKSAGDRVNTYKGYKMATGPQPRGDMAQVAFAEELSQLADLYWVEAYEGKELKRVEALLKEADKRNLKWEPDYAC